MQVKNVLCPGNPVHVGNQMYEHIPFYPSEFPFYVPEFPFHVPEHSSRFPRMRGGNGWCRFMKRVSSFSIPEQRLRDRRFAPRDPEIPSPATRTAPLPGTAIQPAPASLSRRGAIISRAGPFRSRWWNIHFTARKIHYLARRIPEFHRAMYSNPEDVFTRAWYERSIPEGFHYTERSCRLTDERRRFTERRFAHTNRRRDFTERRGDFT